MVSPILGRSAVEKLPQDLVHGLVVLLRRGIARRWCRCRRRRGGGRGRLSGRRRGNVAALAYGTWTGSALSRSALIHAALAQAAAQSLLQQIADGLS